MFNQFRRFATRFAQPRSFIAASALITTAYYYEQKEQNFKLLPQPYFSGVSAYCVQKCEQTNFTDPYLRSRKGEAVNKADEMVVIGGNANPELFTKVLKALGRSPASGQVKKFADGEVSVSFDSQEIKEKHVYIVQSTCRPVNDNLMELILMVSACKRAGAKSVTCVLPYYGYARQDRRFANKATAVSSADVAQILEFQGVKNIITIDMHNVHAQGYVSSKVCMENFEAAFAGLSHFLNTVKDKDNLVIVSPDAGGVARAKKFHSHFKFHGFDQVGMALIHKERKVANQIESMMLIGDVSGKTCVIVDDMVDTAGTLCQAADLLKENGAREVHAFMTHGIFSGPAADRIAASNSLDTIVTSDSMPLEPQFKAKVGDKHKQVSLDLLVAEVIRRLHQGESTEDIYNVPVYK